MLKFHRELLLFVHQKRPITNQITNAFTDIHPNDKYHSADDFSDAGTNIQGLSCHHFAV